MAAKTTDGRRRRAPIAPAPMTAVDVVGVLGSLTALPRPAVVQAPPVADVAPRVVVAPVGPPPDAPPDAPIRGTAGFVAQVAKLRELQAMRWRNTVALHEMEDADKERLALIKLKQQSLDEEEKAIRNYLKLFHADDLRAMHGQVAVRIRIEELGADGVTRLVSEGELM